MIVVTGGGTGGHVIPAMSITEELVKRGFEVVFVGNEQGIEKKIFNLPVRKIFVNLAGIKGKSITKALKGAILTAMAVITLFFYFLGKKPKAVIGTGGFVCVPAAIAGFFLGAKIYLQEQNAIPGASVKYLSRIAKKVFAGFEEAKAYLDQKKVLVTGNPIKSIFFNEPLKYNVFRKDEKMNILVLGGSQGARFINQLMVEAVRFINMESVNIFHQAGESNKEWVQKAYEDLGISAHVFGFTDNMPEYYKKAHLIIGRSGAMTVSEIIAVRRPAVLIPFPFAIYDHQTKNAEALKNAGGALVFQEKEMDSKRLAEIIADFLNNPDKLEKMSKNMESFAFRNAAEEIVNHIMEDLNCTKRM